MASSRSLGVSVASALVLLAAVAGYALGRRQRRAVVASTPSLAASLDAVSLAPHATRFVLAADLVKLRTAPATAPLFARLTQDASDCGPRIASRVRRAFAFARDATLDDSAFAFETSVGRDELMRCLHEARASRPWHTSLVRYRGVELAHAIERRAPELPPAFEGTDVAALPGGLVLAGPSGAVRSMIDRAFAAGHDGDEGARALSPALRALHEKLERGYAIAALVLVSPSRSRWPSALEGVEGIAVGAWADDRLRVEAALSCADFDSPRAVADQLSVALRDLASNPSLGPLSRFEGALRIERRASDVRVRLELSADEVVTLAAALRSIVDTLGHGPAPEQTEDGGLRSDATLLHASTPSVTSESR
jgi:hypothetical protein